MSPPRKDLVILVNDAARDCGELGPRHGKIDEGCGLTLNDCHYRCLTLAGDSIVINRVKGDALHPITGLGPNFYPHYIIPGRQTQ